MSRPGFLGWLRNFIRAFGPWRGVRPFRRAGRLLARGGEGAPPLRLPGVPRPLRVRSRPNDLAIRRGVFVKRKRDLCHTPRSRHVEAVCRRLLADGEWSRCSGTQRMGA